MSTILIVEDEHALSAALEVASRRAGHSVVKAASGAAALKALATSVPEAVVLDIGLPDMSGLEVLRQLREKHETLPVLVITAHGTLDHAIAAQQLGATDYLTKPLDLRRYSSALTALLVSTAAPAAPAFLTESEVPTMIGGTAIMQPVFLSIARASKSSSPVLISGPTGSGKTLAARLIQSHSSAGAAGTRLIEHLDQCTAEVQAELAADLSQPTQKQRIIVTLTGSPESAMQEGRLCPELYYALSALPIHLPALSQRSADLPGLCAFFLGLAGSTASFTAPAMAALQAYAWPGNVRELRAAVTYAADQAKGGPIYLSHLPAHLAPSATLSIASPQAGQLEEVLPSWLDERLPEDAKRLPSYDSLLDQIETQMLRHLLTKYGDKPTHLATALHMNRATLRQKLRRLLPEQEEG